MHPEEVFKDITTTEWATRLCRFLITRESFIEKTLADQFTKFCERIRCWDAEHLNDDQPLEATARVLFDICDEFGLLEHGQFGGLQHTRVRGTVRTKGAGVRTRGGEGVAAGNVVHDMAEVARVFGRARQGVR